MAGKKGQKKRFWSDDEKRSIRAQTAVGCVSVAQVARRYAMVKKGTAAYYLLKTKFYDEYPTAQDVPDDQRNYLAYPRACAYNASGAGRC